MTIWRKYWRFQDSLELSILNATMKSNTLVLFIVWWVAGVLLSIAFGALEFAARYIEGLLSFLFGGKVGLTLFLALWLPTIVLFVLPPSFWMFRWFFLMYERLFSSRIWAKARAEKLQDRLEVANELLGPKA